MSEVVISLNEQEVMLLEAIVMDKDKDEAFKFCKDVVRAKIKSQGSTELRSDKPMGTR